MWSPHCDKEGTQRPGVQNQASSHRAARLKLLKKLRMSEAGKTRENSGRIMQGKLGQRVHAKFYHQYKGLRELLPRWPKCMDKTPIQKNLCTPMFIAAQFTIAKYWKQPKCPSANEWIKK